MKKLSIALAATGLALGAAVAGAQVGAEGSGSEIGSAAQAQTGSLPTQFYAITPYRAYDSRAETKLAVGVADGTSFDPTKDSSGVQQIPADAEAIAYNIAAFSTEGAGFITLFGCFDGEPSTSAVNWGSSGVNSNSAGIIRPSIEARETITSLLCANIGGLAPAATHFTIDVTGYFATTP